MVTEQDIKYFLINRVVRFSDEESWALQQLEDEVVNYNCLGTKEVTSLADRVRVIELAHKVHKEMVNQGTYSLASEMADSAVDIFSKE